VNESLSENIVFSEKKLLSAFIKADNKTTLYLYKTCLPSVSNYICRNGGSDDDARDVFQEALLALYKQAQESTFVLTASIKTYLFSICRYQWLKTLRKNKRLEPLRENFDLPDINNNVIIHLEMAERFIILQDHISKFNGNSRKILELHFQKYSTNEIAQKLSLSKLYVKKKKFECKKQLTESLKMDLRCKEIMQF
jgi:RNA polymerase sigma factor (sigma-70 family)